MATKRLPSLADASVGGVIHLVGLAVPLRDVGEVVIAAPTKQMLAKLYDRITADDTVVPFNPKLCPRIEIRKVEPGA